MKRISSAVCLLLLLTFVAAYRADSLPVNSCPSGGEHQWMSLGVMARFAFKRAPGTTVRVVTYKDTITQEVKKGIAVTKDGATAFVEESSTEMTKVEVEDIEIQSAEEVDEVVEIEGFYCTLCGATKIPDGHRLIDLMKRLSSMDTTTSDLFDSKIKFDDVEDEEEDIPEDLEDFDPDEIDCEELLILVRKGKQHTVPEFRRKMAYCQEEDVIADNKWSIGVTYSW